jgi:hypothetical protein
VQGVGCKEHRTNRILLPLLGGGEACRAEALRRESGRGSGKIRETLGPHLRLPLRGEETGVSRLRPFDRLRATAGQGSQKSEAYFVIHRLALPRPKPIGEGGTGESSCRLFGEQPLRYRLLSGLCRVRSPNELFMIPDTRPLVPDSQGKVYSIKPCRLNLPQP